MNNVLLLVIAKQLYLMNNPGATDSQIGAKFKDDMEKIAVFLRNLDQSSIDADEI